jgi:NAD-dependent dihydropyrimidine dehydrogenase PreA subunit
MCRKKDLEIMPVRDIIEIDEEKCNGCGECIPNCAEGSLQIIDGKARLIRDDLCDGLGACLGHCPQGALRIIQREAPDFDEEAVEEHLAKTGQCGGDCSQVVVDTTGHSGTVGGHNAPAIPSALRQWPIALRLVPVMAPYFKNADLLVTADCVPFAYGNFHQEFLRDKVVVFGCPKFDDAKGYVEKLAEILRANTIKSITLVIMEVPCCSGLQRIVELALSKSGKTIPLHRTVITVRGEKSS